MSLTLPALTPQEGRSKVNGPLWKKSNHLFIWALTLEQTIEPSFSVHPTEFRTSKSWRWDVFVLPRLSAWSLITESWGRWEASRDFVRVTKYGVYVSWEPQQDAGSSVKEAAKHKSMKEQTFLLLSFPKLSR